VRTAFPTTSPASRARCASAALSRGNVAYRDPQIAGVEVPRCLFENRSLTFSLFPPPEHGRRRHPREGDSQIPFLHRCGSPRLAQGLSTFETRSPYGRTSEKQAVNVLPPAATVALWRAGVSRLIVGATLLSVLFAAHAGYPAAVGLVALFVAEFLRFQTPRGEAAPSRAPEPA